MPRAIIGSLLICTVLYILVSGIMVGLVPYSQLKEEAAPIAAAITAPVKADPWNKKTIITINEPVQMPSCCNAEHTIVLPFNEIEPGASILADDFLVPTAVPKPS